jgi:hypothetical protein
LGPASQSSRSALGGFQGAHEQAELIVEIVGGWVEDSCTLRWEVIEAVGEAGLIGAAGVIANFSMMNRIADATGMPTGRGTLARTADVCAALGLDRFMHAWSAAHVAGSPACCRRSKS